jgi:hypothetical protein
MHEVPKEVVIYVTTEKINAQEDEVGEDGSEFPPSSCSHEVLARSLLAVPGEGDKR